MRSVNNTAKKICQEPKSPGPGTYKDKTLEIGYKSRKSSLHGRNFYLDATEQAIKWGVPGPGTYEDV